MNAPVIAYQALALPEPEREDFLVRACGSDDALRRQVGLLVRRAQECRAPAPAAGAGGSAWPSTGHPSADRGDWTPPPIPPPSPVVGGPAAAGFQVMERLGHGGMGVVYKARQVALNRVVALKMILSGPHASAAELARFRTEAEAAARLQHPGIVQVFEVGESEGRPYLALEYVPGSTLHRALGGGPWPPAKAAALVEQMARAVQAAHERGVLHRDLKPANVLLTEDGAPKISDFGLAKLDEAGQTRTGDVMGTPSYMAPEQAEGRKDVGPPADVYALGAILYECLTGRPPFQAATTRETLDQVIKDEPVSPRRLNPAVPRDVETIALKCLEKSPARRYRRASELADDLRRYLDGEPIRARPVPAWERGAKWCRRRPWPAALVGMAAVSSAAILALLLYAVAKNSELGRANADLDQAADGLRRTIGERDRTIGERDQALREKGLALDESKAQLRANFVGNGLEAAGQRDLNGALAWYAAALRLSDGEDDKHLQRLRLFGLLRQMPRVARVLPHGDAVGSAQYGGAGRRLVLTTTRTKAHVWDAATGRELAVLAHPAPVQSAAFRPGTDDVVTFAGDGVLRLWQAGRAERERAVKGAQLGKAQFDGAGKRVVLIAAALDGAGVRRKMFVWRPEGDALGEVPHDEAVTTGAVSPKGTAVATATASGARLWDLERSPFQPRRLDHGGEVAVLSFNNRGDRLVTGGSGVARLWDARTGALVWSKALPGEVVSAVFTASDDTVNISYPGGAALCAAADGAVVVPGDADLVSLRYDEGQLSADQRHRLSVTGRQVRVLDLAGELSAAPLVPVPRAVRHADVSHDSRRLLLIDEGQGARVWDLEAGRWLYAHPEGAHAGAFSPADATLALAGADLVCLDAQGGEVYRARAPAGGTAGVAFSGDGRLVAVTGSLGEVHVHDLKSRKMVWSPPAGGGVVQAELDRAGRRLLTLGGGGERVEYTLRLWDVEQRREVAALARARGDFIPFGSFNADGDLVIGAAGPDEAGLWGAADGRLVRRLAHPRAGPAGQLTLAKLSPGGRLALTVSTGLVAHLWDADAGTVLATLPQSGVADASFSPGTGWAVLTASQDRTIRLFDSRTGLGLLSVGTGQQGPVERAVFSPDGRRVVALSDKGRQVRVWDVGLDPSLPDADLIDLAELLSGQSGRSGALAPVAPEWAEREGRRLMAAHPGLFRCRDEQASEYHWHQANHAARVQDWESARRHWDRLRVEFGGRLTEAHLAQVHAGRGYALIQLRRYEEAEADYREAARLAPRGGHGDWMAYAQSMQGRLAEALASYTAAPPPEFPQAVGHQNRGELHARLALTRPGHWAYAEAHFRAALGAGGVVNEPRLWRYLAVCLVAQGRRAAYDDLRRQLMTRFAGTEDAAQAEEVARALCLAPIIDSEVRRTLVTLAARVANKRAGNASFTATLAAAEYRAGLLGYAHQDMLQAIKLYGGPEKSAIDVFPFLAMTLHRRYYGAEARRAWEEGVRRLQGARQERALRHGWHSLAEWGLLLREAEAELRRPTVEIPDAVVPLPPAAELARSIRELSAGLKEAPEKSDLRYRRGLARLQLGLQRPAEADWPGAADDLVAALKGDDAGPAVWYFAGLALLRRGDGKGYDELCRRAVKKFPPAAGSLGGGDLLWLCSLGPNRALSAEQARTAQGGPAEGDVFLQLAARYRALGEAPVSDKDRRPLGCFYVEAFVPLYLRSVQAPGSVRGVPDAQCWLYLALAKQGLGKRIEARAWLEGARAAVEKVRRGEEKLSWNRWLELEVLLREADAATQAPAGGP